MSERPTVSIVLPTFNERGHIVDLIVAIQEALPGGVEIIVVDDDSPDDTWQAVQDYATSHPNVRLLRRIGRRGLTSAFNEGIGLSTGRVVCWMDCDFPCRRKSCPNLWLPPGSRIWQWAPGTFAAAPTWDTPLWPLCSAAPSTFRWRAPGLLRPRLHQRVHRGPKARPGRHPSARRLRRVLH